MSLRVVVRDTVACLQELSADGRWIITNVGGSGKLETGVYELDAAIDALPEHAYVGLLLLLTSDFVYQLMPDHRIVRHSCGPVAKPPATGDLCVVTYEQGKATVGGTAPAGSKAVRGRSRAA